MTRCKVCGRPLTDPESVWYGLGPECRRDLPVPRGRRRFVRRRGLLVDARTGEVFGDKSAVRRRA